jgi:hypothetical protein
MVFREVNMEKFTALLRRFRTVLGILAIVAVVVVAGSFIVSAIWTGPAVLAQRIEPKDAAAASLFGDDGSNSPGTAIGSPQRFIVTDAQAFLEGTGPSGERYLNEKYLREQNIYPLQAKTIEFFRDVTALVAGAAALLLAGLWFLGRPN